MKNTIYTGDNLQILTGMNSDTVDLIYLDPPFNSNKVYSATTGSIADGASFKDKWTVQDRDSLDSLAGRYSDIAQYINSIGSIHSDSMMSYITYMTQRLIELHRVLKPTGSLYLHCDPTASHYLKIVLDRIFGRKQFRNEIVWKRSTIKGTRGRRRTLGSITDTILFYAKENNFINIPKVFDKKIKFPYKDSKGNYRAVTSLIGGAGLHSCPKYSWNGYTPKYGWVVSNKNILKLEAADYIHYNKNQNPYRKQYDYEYKGADIGNLWDDISIARGLERTGFPTQKPLALMYRIIKASSNEGDVVLDPFCGCATTCVAAEQLQRKWIGIDVSAKAVEIGLQRLAAIKLK